MPTRPLRAACLLAVALLTSGCLQPTVAAVPYSAAGSAATIGDIYLPAANGNVGTIVFVHGGGFDSGSRADIMKYGGPVVGQTLRGWGVLSIDYRLDPFPAGVLDLADAVNFVRSERGRELGLSSDRIVVFGHSAGAAIVGNLALARNEGNVELFGALPPVDGWISAGGLLEFDVPGSVTAHDAWRTGGNPAASPSAHIDAGDPPGLIIHGTKDPVVSVAHALRFIADARSVGYPVNYRIFNDRTLCSSHGPVCEAVRPDLERFLDRIARG